MCLGCIEIQILDLLDMYVWLYDSEMLMQLRFSYNRTKRQRSNVIIIYCIKPTKYCYPMPLTFCCGINNISDHTVK